MIDRATFDLRIAGHRDTTAHIDACGWRQGEPQRRPFRAALAAVLVALATHLAPGALGADTTVGGAAPAAA